ncbi:hypothetical protein [Staphylococcus gallinarum]|uniref:hypothetical protein n=1 Tax=Staphylococcus TaxID=1279 RepID=UPI000E691FA5|nr:hypothetical protein [Staphylococcus gallinarum]RIL23402.1 hypothetical protein BUY99_05285 [Staphylococcus gallinarum]
MKNKKLEYKRLNFNLQQKMIDDLDRLIKLSPKYTTRTQLIEHILSQYLNDVKHFNPYFDE